MIVGLINLILIGGLVLYALAAWFDITNRMK